MRMLGVCAPSVCASLWLFFHVSARTRTLFRLLSLYGVSLVSLMSLCCLGCPYLPTVFTCCGLSNDTSALYLHADALLQVKLNCLAVYKNGLVTSFKNDL